MIHEQEVLNKAYELLVSSPGLGWTTFFCQIMGLNGVIRQTYRTLEELADFQKTDTYREILWVLTRLRERAIVREDPREPTRVITVRLPKSVHEALRVEAHEHQTSMNKLCISKLLAAIDSKLVPEERWNRAQQATHTAEERS